MIWLLALSILSPESLQLQGHAGSVLETSIMTNQPAQIQVQYPLRIRSYEDNQLTLSIRTDAKPGNYTLTTYAIDDSDDSLKTAIGIPTHLQVSAAHSSQSTSTKQFPWTLAILAVLATMFVSGAVRISLR